MSIMIDHKIRKWRYALGDIKEIESFSELNNFKKEHDLSGRIVQFESNDEIAAAIIEVQYFNHVCGGGKKSFADICVIAKRKKWKPYIISALEGHSELKTGFSRSILRVEDGKIFLVEIVKDEDDKVIEL